MFSNSLSVFICTPDLLFWFPTIAACSMFCCPHFHCDWYSTSTSRQPCFFFAGTHLWPGQRWVPLQGKLIDLYWKASLTYLMTVALTADPSALQNSASKFWRMKSRANPSAKKLQLDLKNVFSRLDLKHSSAKSGIASAKSWRHSAKRLPLESKRVPLWID